MSYKIQAAMVDWCPVAATRKFLRFLWLSVTVGALLPAQTSPGGAAAIDGGAIDSAALSQIEQSEQRLHALEVSADCRKERWNPLSKDWEVYGSVSFTARFDGVPGGQSLIDIESETVRVDGPEPSTVDRSVVFAYNGRIGTTWQRKEGGDLIQRGLVLPRRPSELENWGHVLAQWNHSIYGLSEVASRRFSEALVESGAIRSEGRGLWTLRRSADGSRFDCEFTAPGYRRLYVLLPGRGMAVESIRSWEDGIIVMDYQVAEFCNPTEGVFYPLKATRTLHDPKGEGLERLVYGARSVSANEDVELGRFVCPWPSECFVTDESTEGLYLLGPNEDGLAARLQAQQELVSASPAPYKSGGADRKAPMSTERKIESSGRSDWWFRTVRVLGTGGLVMAGFWLGLRKKMPKGSRAAMIAVFLSGGASAQSPDLWSTELPGFRISNCSLNSVCYVLGHFGKDVDGRVVKEVAAQLKVGEQWSRRTSLLSMKNTLVGSGLSVASIRVQPETDIRPLMEDEAILVVHTQEEKDSVGHYFTVVRHVESHFLIVDAGASTYWIHEADIGARILDKASGHALRIWRGKGTEDSPLVLPSSAPVTISHGTAERSPGILDVRIHVKNEGNYALAITGSSGSCSCFEGVEWESKAEGIGPGASDVMLVQFDRSRLKLGSSEQDVFIVLKGATESKILVKILMSVVDPPKESRIAVFPESLHMGRLSRYATTAPEGRIRIMLPEGADVSSIGSTSGSVTVEAVDRGRPTGAGPDGRFIEYRVKLTPPADQGIRYLRETIQIVCSGTASATIAVPIKGEWTAPRQ